MEQRGGAVSSADCNTDEEEDGCGDCVNPSECASLIARARREGFLVWSAGSVPLSIDDYDGESEPESPLLYADQCCITCGHAPCPCCGSFCDHHDCIFADEEHDCAYESEPRFFLGDGTAWEG